MDILHTHSIPNGKDNMANALTYRLNKKDLAISNTCSNINTLKGETENYACTYIHMYKMPLITAIIVIDYMAHRLMPKNGS